MNSLAYNALAERRFKRLLSLHITLSRSLTCMTGCQKKNYLTHKTCYKCKTVLAFKLSTLFHSFSNVTSISFKQLRNLICSYCILLCLKSLKVTHYNIRIVSFSIKTTKYQKDFIMGCIEVWHFELVSCPYQHL